MRLGRVSEIRGRFNRYQTLSTHRNIIFYANFKAAGTQKKTGRFLHRDRPVCQYLCK